MSAHRSWRQGRRLAELGAAVVALLVLTGVMSTAAEPVPPGSGQPNQLDALQLAKAQRSPAAREIDSNLLAAVRQAAGAPAATTPDGRPVAIRTEVPTDGSGRAVVDLTATPSPELDGAVTAAGGQVLVAVGRFDSVRAALPFAALEGVAARADVTAIDPAAEPDTTAHQPAPRPSRADRGGAVSEQLRQAMPAIAGTTGSRASEGDVTHGASGVRDALGADGSGVTVGVLSDGVRSLAASQTSRDLPPVTVLPGQAGPSNGDEGTAMLEIVHDLAPGARLLFATAFTSPSSFAQNILDLRAAGAQIIVDDVFYFDEPALQDGPIARAVDTVTAQGAVYLSSAGNSGNADDGTSSTWEGDFGPGPAVGTAGVSHDYDPGPAVTVTDPLAGSSVASPATLWWSDPLRGSVNDYDLYLLDAAGNVVASSTNSQTGTQDPTETLSVPAGRTDLRLQIVKYSGADRFLHLSVNGNRFAGPSTPGQVIGHAAANGALSVAAAPAAGPAGSGPSGPFPGPFTAAQRKELFSSDGPRRVFFDPAGAALTPGNFSASGGQVRQDPDLTAADGVTTNTPGFRPFFGTSAAAPHAAAIAAQALGAAPGLTADGVRDALRRSAIDLATPGVDRNTGAGVVMSDPAVRPVAPTGPSFRPVNQVRLQDTRTGAGNTTTDGLFQGTGAFAAGETRNLAVTGRGNVPADASAVALTVTVIAPSSSGYLTAFPAGATRPTASNLNFVAGQTVTGTVLAGVGANGQVSLYNYFGSAQVLVDVSGYVGPQPAAFTPLTPARLLETRTGNSTYRTADGQFQGTGPLAPGEARDLVVTGRGGVPLSGVDAVALTVTATEPTATAYLTAYPAGTPRPNASNLNYVAGQTVPNTVLVKVGSGGRITLFNNTGRTQVVADVAGYFAAGSAFHGLTPARLFETRSGAEAATIDGRSLGGGRFAPGETRTFPVAGRGGVPGTGVGAVALNLTATEQTAAGSLTAFPAGRPRPGTLSVSYPGGQTYPNTVVVAVGSNGQVSVTNTSGSPQVIADVTGWFDAPG